MLSYNDRPQHLLDADDARAEGAGRLARADLPVKVNEALQRKKKALGRPKICELARAILWEYSYKRLKLAQFLGQLGVFLTYLVWRSQRLRQDWQRGPETHSKLIEPFPRRELVWNEQPRFGRGGLDVHLQHPGE